MKFYLLFILFGISLSFQAQDIAVMKYEGGGDWYGNPTSVPNLIRFCNQNIATNIDPKVKTVEPDSPELFSYPFVHLTGHGNVDFSPKALKNLRAYLKSGVFLHIDDNYGMSKYIRREIKKLFPDKKLQELPADHPLFSAAYDFPNGLPKIHEHDGKRPQAFGIFQKNRLLLLFTFQSDLGDGWENEEVHHDPLAVRKKALKMGANIVKYAFEH